MLLFAPWITNWLTPIWLICVGVAIGLLALLAIWAIAAILSRLPGIGRLAEQRQSLGKIVTGLTVLLTVGLSGLIVARSWSAWQELGGQTLVENLGVTLLAAAAISLILSLALVHFTSRRTVREIPGAIREGALWPLFLLSVCLTVFAAAGAVVAFKPMELINAVGRTPFVGRTVIEATIPPANLDEVGVAVDPPQHAVEMGFLTGELKEILFNSSETLTVDFEKSEDVDIDPVFRIPADDGFRWFRIGQSIEPFAEGATVAELFIRNYGANDAQVKITVTTQPVHPEVSTVVITAMGTVLLFLLYLLQRSAMPRLSAVALATFKSEVAQPLFLIMVSGGIVALILFIWIPYNTFGEDIKMLKDSGMTLIMVLCIIQAVWAASTSVSEEIEGKTALTVLSKPIGRRSFIIGKYAGIAWTVAVMFIALGLVLLIVVAYKPIYDARESSLGQPTWQACHLEMIGIVPGLILAFMETLVLASLSVAISTRLPMLGNFIICFTIYVLGHLTPLLVQSSAESFEPVQFVATFLATVLPILDHFNIQAAVAAGIGVPHDYLGWSLVYCLIYGMIALLLALVLFEDRDLA